MVARGGEREAGTEGLRTRAGKDKGWEEDERRWQRDDKGMRDVVEIEGEKWKLGKKKKVERLP